MIEGWSDALWLGFLEARNPNVPGLVEKIRPTFGRESLRRPARTLARGLDRGALHLHLHRSGRSIPGRFALDHVLPRSFVAHDRLWNLTPIDPPSTWRSAIGCRIYRSSHRSPFSMLRSTVSPTFCRKSQVVFGGVVSTSGRSISDLYLPVGIMRTNRTSSSRPTVRSSALWRASQGKWVSKAAGVRQARPDASGLAFGVGPSRGYLFWRRP